MSTAEVGWRREGDLLGELEVPAGVLYGIHTVRAQRSFGAAGRPVHPALVHAFGEVKQAAAVVNHRLGALADDEAAAQALERACGEMARGLLDDHVVVDALQGGAGTSTNMNVNEVLANHALQLLGEPLGHYARISPLDDVNRHQSTNDTYPTALRIAALRLLAGLEAAVVELQEAFQAKERQFEGVVKVGRTQLQDAVLTTLGRSMGAYADVLSRDRWRLYKCGERLRVVNLGGTAIGTGLGAPRRYIFEVVEELRAITGLPLARAENLVEATQNQDALVETSGMLKTYATNLVRICADLRLLASGPEAGLGELRLPPRQAGSSIMPGKVNPVIPEAAQQAALLYLGYDQVITAACAMGSLELCPFLPLVADCLLGGMSTLTSATSSLARLCVAGLEADDARCSRSVASSTAAVTALVPALGYEGASAVATRARERGESVRASAVALGLLSEAEVDSLTSPQAVCRLGSPSREDSP